MDSFYVTRPARGLLWVQGLFYVVTGLWPILHMASFLAVTGPKTDLWLVQTVGALLAAIGVTWCVAGSLHWPGLPSVVLAVLVPLVLIVVDVVFTTARVISPIYLLDAGMEVLFLVGWLVLGVMVTRGSGHTEGKFARHLAASWR